MPKVRDYKVGPRNSEVLGIPGREFDWSKFCWDGSEVYIEFSLEGRPVNSYKAPLPNTDNFFIAPNCEYIHVPYNWAEDCTSYRVRPNASMYAGRTYRGHRVKKQTAVKKDDGWYWRLHE